MQQNLNKKCCNVYTALQKLESQDALEANRKIKVIFVQSQYCTASDCSIIC